MKKEKLIILIPFAGGSSYSLKGLSDEIAGATVLTLELPGRGKRVKEELSTNLHEIVADLYEKAKASIDAHETYYIYGHSLGALLGYLLIHKIIDHTGKVARHLFVSGRGGPSKDQKEDKTYLLPSKEFRAKLKEMGGSPNEVLADEELMDFFEPILRTDFELSETYHHEHKEVLDVPITAMYGRDEETTDEEVNLWQQETSRPLNSIEFSGNHFFIFDHWKEISTLINEVFNEVPEFKR